MQQDVGFLLVEQHLAAGGRDEHPEEHERHRVKRCRQGEERLPEYDNAESPSSA